MGFIKKFFKGITFNNIKFNIILCLSFILCTCILSYIFQCIWNYFIPELYKYAPTLDYSQSFLVITFLGIMSLLLKIYSEN